MQPAQDVRHYMKEKNNQGTFVLLETKSTMETATSARTASSSSVVRLLGDLTGEAKDFIRQEISLAKTEISEKISVMGKNAVSLAIGGFVAYAGLIVFLIGLGFLLAWVFQIAGLEPVMAHFVGMAVIGLLVLLIGGAFIGKALSAFKRGSLSPERTIQTLQELRTDPAEYRTQHAGEEDSRSSEDIQHQVEATEQRMSETLGELGRRLSPSYINMRLKNRISVRPYSSGFIAVVAGLFSGLLLRRKWKRA
jgi:hypothetical protein